jgi:DNA invertase Pin-like site-specific DNA recombinase
MALMSTVARSGGARVLGRLRLSIARDESTSIERQREAITAWAEAGGHQIVGWAEDSDVSGSVDPFETPRLGDWLNNRADQFDVICAWKLDRISRNSIKLNKLFGWCLDHDKTVVSTSEGIDLGTPVGRLIANVIAFLAEGELEAIRERTISSRRKLRETARWAGGRPPYGYRVVESPNGGKVLEIDPEAHAVVRRIVDALLDEVPLARIADNLNREGILAPAEHYRALVGKPNVGTGVWKPGPIRKMLLAPTLMGYAHLGGVAVRDDQGDQVLMAEPLVTDDERELIRAELARTEKGNYQRLKTAPLVGVLFCWFCEAAMSSSVSKNKRVGRDYRYYRCHTNKCCYVPAETAEEAVERELLSTLGEEQVTERVWVPGNSSEAELRAAVAAFDELSATAGVMTSRTAKDRLQRQLSALDARIAKLEAMPAHEGRYEYRPTGETYREAWEKDADPEARRDLLKRVGVNFRIGVADGRLQIHPIALGDRLKLPEWAQVDERSSPEEIQRWQEAAAAERRKWGVPDSE